MTRKIAITILMILIVIVGKTQIPVVTPPQPATFQNYSTVVNTQTENQYFIPNYNQSNGLTRTEINNQTIMQEVQYYEQLKLQQSNNSVTSYNVNYSFPQIEDAGKSYFETAYEEFEKMLDGQQEMSIKRAVFLSENAYYQNQMPYNKFEQVISNIAFVCEQQMVQNNMPNTDLAKNLAIYQFFADTIEIDLVGQEKTFTHYPLQYEFRDYRGDTIWENLFVTKLLYTQSGQCHSMPLLYLIIAEELGANAWLSYAPKHTYIKFQTENNRWQNFETTNGYLTSDAFILQSGYIKAEALVNKVYMDTLSKQQTIAHCLLDLAKNYERIYGYDDFYLQCVNKALEIHPNNIVGNMMKSNYYNALWYYIQLQYQNIPKQYFQTDTNAYEIYLQAVENYDFVRELGYEDIPEEVYQQWLNSAKSEESQENELFLRQSIIRLK